MQNRYDRNRGQDRQSGSDWLNDDDTSWEGRDRNRDESRSWAGGAEREFRRSEGYGQSSGQGRGDYGRSSTPYDRYDSQSNDPGRSYGGRGYDSGSRYGHSPRSGEFGQDYGYGRAYGQGSSQGYGRGRGSYDMDSSRDYRGSRYSQDDRDEGYAPGAQIWQGGRGGASAGRSDYEPDYLHWREQQMSKFDKDYDDWRAEKRQKFSSDFDTWRTSRNAIVENVSDGGTGSQKDVKNS